MNKYPEVMNCSSQIQNYVSNSIMQYGLEIVYEALKLQLKMVETSIILQKKNEEKEKPKKN